MNKKIAGMMIGAGAGLALAWMFRGRLLRMSEVRADIVVKTGDDGRPHVEFVTDEITVKRNHHARWWVDNRANVEVLVALADWEDLEHRPVPPAVEADPDDHEHPPQRGLSREVPAGKHRPIRGRARAPRGGAHDEKVKYAVHLDGRVEVDPIVKLTP